MPAARSLLLFLVLASCFAHSALAAERTHAPDYYRDAERGWFWYETPPPPAPPPPPKTPPTGQGGASPAPPPLSAAWLRAHLDDYRDAAIDSPNDTNVSLYLYLQRVALEKADAFKNAAQRVILNSPGLDEDQRTPQSAVAKATASQVSKALLDRVMARLSANAGVWYFFRSDCPYCRAQGPVLEAVQASHGLAVMPISLDGLPTPDGRYANFRTDQGQAAKLGVTATPTLFLVTASGQVAKLSEGLQTQAALEDRILRVAHEAGLVSDSEFNTIMWRANDSLLDTLPASELAAAAQDPQRLAALLRSAAQSGTSAPATPTTAPPVRRSP